MTTRSMDTDWYYLRRGAPPEEQAGPLTWEEFHSQAQAGRFSPDDLVWNPALPDWTSAAQVPGLFPSAAQSAGAVSFRETPPVAFEPVAARRRRLWPILTPVIALLLIGAGLGIYFGFFHDRDDNDGDGATVSSETTSTTGESAGLGVADCKQPDRARLIDTSTWGEVPVNQIVVVLADGGSRGDANDLAQALGGSVVGELEFLNAYQIETGGSSETDLQAALDQATAAPGVELAFPNMQVVEATEFWGVPRSPLSDPAYGDDRGKGLELIGAQKAWNYIRGAGLQLWDVHVGVVDSGIYKGTGEFDGDVNVIFPDPEAGERATPSKNNNSQSGIASDDPTGSHGTMVSAIIGADAENGGQTGVASPVLGHHLTVSAIDYEAGKYGLPEVPNPDPNDPTIIKWTNGKSYSFGALVALTKQVENGAKIINCSFGSEKPGPQNAIYAAAFRKFFEKMAAEHPDVTFVCAAGNEGGQLTKTNYAPAGAASGLPNVITVGNVMNDGSLEGTQSNVAGADAEVTLAAPGHEIVQGVDEEGQPIVAGYTDGGYTNYGGGTSAATPQVSAAAAMLLSLNPNLTAAEIKDILSKTARPGPSQVGGKILAIDQAVLEVINQQREKQGLPRVTGEELEKAGMIDAVATTTDDPDVYSVRGVVTMVPVGGVEITFTASPGVTIEDGEATQSLDAPGEVEWPAVRVAVSDPKNPTTIVVTRKDTGAASVITLDQIDLNGFWEGSLIITNIELSPEAQEAFGQLAENPPEDLEGCDLSSIPAVLEQLEGKPCPMTLDITAQEDGTGTVMLFIDFSPLGEVAEAQEPAQVPMTWSGNSITFSATEGGQAMTLSGEASRSGDSLVMNGTMTIVATEEGTMLYTLYAEWRAMKQ